MNISKVIDITYKTVVVTTALAKLAVIGLLAYGVNKKYAEQPTDKEEA